MTELAMLERRLAGYALAAGAAIAVGQTAEAAVQYEPLDPDLTFIRGDGDQEYALDVDGDLVADFTFSFADSSTSYTSSGKPYFFRFHPVNVQVGAWSFSGSTGSNRCLGALTGNGWAAALNSDRSLSSTAASAAWINRPSMAWTGSSNDGKFARGYFLGKNQRFLGLRFRLADGWHHGWCRLSVDKKAGSFTIHDYAYEDTPDAPIVTGLLRATRLEGTVGSRVALNAADVDNTGGTFTAPPKVTGTYFDPVKGKKTAKAAIKGTLNDDGTAVRLDLKKKVRLYDAKAFKENYKWGGRAARLLSGMVNQGMYFNLDVTHQEGGGETVDRNVCIALMPPAITGVVGVPEPGNAITVIGDWFGVKPPKAWLEYRLENAKTGQNVTKMLKLKALKPYAYANAKGKADASCMNVDTGESQVQYQLPAAWPTDFNTVDLGTHDLVIDNGIGLACWPLLDP
jgi:hypothetical protein